MPPLWYVPPLFSSPTAPPRISSDARRGSGWLFCGGLENLPGAAALAHRQGPCWRLGAPRQSPGSRPAARSTTGAAQEPLGRSQSRPRVAQEAICLLAEARGIRMPQAVKQSSQAISPDTIFFESTLFRALDAWVHSCQRYL